MQNRSFTPCFKMFSPDLTKESFPNLEAKQIAFDPSQTLYSVQKCLVILHLQIQTYFIWILYDRAQQINMKWKETDACLSQHLLLQIT